MVPSLFYSDIMQEKAFPLFELHFRLHDCSQFNAQVMVV